MTGYVYKGTGHRLGIHRELFEKQEARVSGQVDGHEKSDDEDHQASVPLTIREILEGSSE